MIAKYPGFQWRAHLHRDWFSNNLHLWVLKDEFKPGGPSEVHCLQMDQFKTHQEGDQMLPESASVSGPYTQLAPMLQQVVDACWEEGIRPRQLATTTAEHQALNTHLADMRALAFSALKIKRP